jgi:signal transduction histidine kinase
MSLHRILSLFVIVLAALSLGAAISLAWLTTSLHRTTVELETALQSVRLVEGMQIDLLTYTRTRDPSLLGVLQGDLRQKLDEAQQYVTDPEEQAMLTDAQKYIEHHFAHQHQAQLNEEIADGDLQNAFSALRRFMDFNLEQADTSMRVSERWDEIGDRIGMGFTAILIIGMAAVLVWLRRVAFQPVFEIQAAIRAFAAGRKESRAPERGPEELKSIAKQFNEMAASLERQSDRQLSFLAAVAHDLRNPVGALKTSAKILSEDRSPETVSHLMSIILRQVNGLDRMIGDLLDQTRIEAGSLELRIQDCDLRSVAQDAFDLFNAGSREHRLTLALPEEPVPFRCDPLRIQQVLNNLISNAIKYSPPETTVDISLERADGEFLFRVSDQGKGIPEEELPFIFEPFRRTAAAREEVPGVGLGLSVAQRIVRAHGGRIKVESTLGVGTTFRVYLPAPRPTARKLTA